MKNNIFKTAGSMSLLVFLLMAFQVNGQLIVNSGVTAEQMVANILGPGVSASNIVLTCDPDGSGAFSNGGTTNIGIDEGVILTSGSINNAPGPNVDDNTTTNAFQPGDAELDALIPPFLTQDACVLEFDFIATGDQITVQYVFASEEYNEYVCSNFNDVFAFFVSGNNPGGGVYLNENVALVPGGTNAVAINNVNNGSSGVNGVPENCGSLDNAAFFIDNSALDPASTIEYDGFTVSLFATVNIIPGDTYHFKFAIADASDGTLDSGVFLKAESFSIFTCDAGTLSIEGSAEICTNDDVDDIVEVFTTSILPDDTYVYILTDGSGEILALQASNLINVEPYANGIYFIYGVSYDGGSPVGLAVGGNVGNLSNPDGCLEISNPLTIVLTNCTFGCTDQGACNFDPNATVDDGSCLYCDDQDPCTIDTCNPATGGCVNTPVDCDDGDPCTLDECSPTGATACIHTSIDCDDGNPCTVDECSPTTATGCINTPVDCDDGDPCTFDECFTATGGCINTPIDCDDGNPCTVDECDPNSAAGCINTPLDCDDGDPCTVDECPTGAGGCIYTPIDCDDGNPCTVDECSPTSATGCINTPIDCDDGDPCTFDECFTATGGCINTPIDCDDGNPCTVDECDPNSAAGCINTPIDCDDGNPCTVDECPTGAGGCVNTPIDCDDGNPCTVDECDPASSTGCVNTPIDCDDGNPCTLDECNPSSGGCIYTPTGGPVNDLSGGALPNTPDRIWGVPGWDTFDMTCATLSAPSCDGSAPLADSWYSFVAQAENQGILVRANPADPNAATADMAVELFDAAFTPLAGLSGGDCPVNRSCFNNVGAGEIERCVPGGLTIGDTYYYRTYDASGGAITTVDTKVKTYANHPILMGCIEDGQTGIFGIWTIESPNNLYNIPPVPVFNVRMVIKDLGGNVVATTPAQGPTMPNGLTFALADFIPAPGPGSYTVHAQNEVKMHANGCVSAYWSQTGPGCTLTIVAGPTVDSSEGIIESDQSFSVYPNPNDGEQVYLELIDFVDLDSDVFVTIVDMYGKQVHMEQFATSANNSQRVITFDQNLSAGMYFVNLTINERVIAQKLVVE